MTSDLAIREFIGSTVAPAEAAWLDARLASQEQKRFAALTLAEAYGWMCLGIRAEAFDRETARTLIRPIAESIREATIFSVQMNLLVKTGTAENLRLLESEQYVPAPFRDSYGPQFQELPQVATIFSLWCSEVSSFDRSSSGRALVGILNFARENAWERAFKEMLDEPFDVDLKDGGRISYFEGYLRVLQHFDRIADLFSLEGIPSEQWPARAIMRLEVGSIHQWRFNFQSVVFEKRFNIFTEAIEERLVREALVAGTKIDLGGFVNGVRNLRSRYLAAFNSLAITA
jgi:hypothetical protein